MVNILREFNLCEFTARENKSKTKMSTFTVVIIIATQFTLHYFVLCLKIKCHRYWPYDEKVAKEFGSLMVTMDSEAVQSHQTIRTFTLEYEMSSETKKVTQYHFTSWPDHGVPKCTESLLQLIEYIRTMYRPNLGPILVHCR